jgi:hypothetical protein
MVNMINEDGSCQSLADARTFAFHQDPYKVPTHRTLNLYQLQCTISCYICISLHRPPPPPPLLQDGIYIAGMPPARTYIYIDFAARFFRAAC